MEFELKLNNEDLLILDEALTQLPYYKVVDLIAKINQQMEEGFEQEGE